jgi:hypothetical protein
MPMSYKHVAVFFSSFGGGGEAATYSHSLQRSLNQISNNLNKNFQQQKFQISLI